MTDLNDALPQHHRRRFLETKGTLQNETMDQFFMNLKYLVYSQAWLKR